MTHARATCTCPFPSCSMVLTPPCFTTSVAPGILVRVVFGEFLLRVAFSRGLLSASFSPTWKTRRFVNRILLACPPSLLPTDPLPEERETTTDTPPDYAQSSVLHPVHFHTLTTHIDPFFFFDKGLELGGSEAYSGQSSSNHAVCCLTCLCAYQEPNLIVFSTIWCVSPWCLVKHFPRVARPQS